MGQFSNRLQLFLLEVVIIQQRIETLYNGSVILFASLQCLSTHF